MDGRQRRALAQLKRVDAEVAVSALCGGGDDTPEYRRLAKAARRAKIARRRR